MSRFVAVVILGLAVAAHADPVAIGKLPAIDVSYVKGKKPTVVVYSTGIDADVLVRGVASYASFVMLAGKKRVEGRIEGAPWSNAVAAIAGDLEVDYIAEPKHPKTPTVDLDFTAVAGADVVNMLRICATVAKVKVVVAEHHDLPAITLRTRRRDPRDVAKVIAKLVGLELVERKHAWYFVEPGTARTAEKQVDSDAVSPPPAEAVVTGPVLPGPEHWKLRATVGVLSDDADRATMWLGIFISDKGVARYLRHCGGGDCAQDLDAMHAKVGDHSYVLER